MTTTDRTTPDCTYCKAAQRFPLHTATHRVTHDRMGRRGLYQTHAAVCAEHLEWVRNNFWVLSISPMEDQP